MRLAYVLISVVILVALFYVASGILAFDAGNSNATYVTKDTTPTDVITEKNTQADTEIKE